MNRRKMDSLRLEGLTGQFVGADDKYLAEVERQCAFELPADYKEFLREYGASFFAAGIVTAKIIYPKIGGGYDTH